MKNFSRDISKLYSYSCNVFEFEHIKDDVSKKTSLKKVLVYENVPCRISYFSRSYVNYIQKNEANNISKQYVKLFLSNEFNIKPGSTITVFKNGEEVATFVFSGSSQKYDYHQEILFSIKEEFC